MGDEPMAAPSPPVQHGSRNGSKAILVICALAVLAAYLFHAAYFIHYVNDDAYITFRYSRFWATGHGPYFNVGEHVEGYSNFLLMLLLVPCFAFGGQAALPLAAKTIGIASGAVSLLLVLAFCRLLTPWNSPRSAAPRLSGIAAAGLVAVSPAFALNSTSGLEPSESFTMPIQAYTISLRCFAARKDRRLSR